MKKLLLLLAIGMVLTSCGEIGTGRRGVLVNYGRVDHSNVLKEGVHFYNPWSYDLVELDVRTEKYAGKLTAYSKDSQTIDMMKQ